VRSWAILPPPICRILPPLANQLVYIVRMSAFASAIGMQQLKRRARTGGQRISPAGTVFERNHRETPR